MYQLVPNSGKKSIIFIDTFRYDVNWTGKLIPLQA